MKKVSHKMHYRNIKSLEEGKILLSQRTREGLMKEVTFKPVLKDI